MSLVRSVCSLSRSVSGLRYFNSMAEPFKVFVTTGGIPLKALEFLRANGCVVDQWSHEGIIPRDEFLKRVQGINGLYCVLHDKVDGELLDAAGKNLKTVCTMSVGLDHVDLPALKSRNIRLGYTPDAVTDSTAELTICLLLSTLRRVVEGVDASRAGEWPNGWRALWLCGKKLSGSTIGFFGLGRIGEAIAERLGAFKCSKMLYYSRTRKDTVKESKLGVTFVPDMNELLSSVDVLVVCCSLNDSTRGILDMNALRRMKRDSYLINPSRGAVLDQDALVKLLAEGHFAGVGLDATNPEPLPTDHPLFKFKNCTIFPHMGSSTYETREDMADLTVKNILAGMRGEKMPAELLQ